MTFKHNGIKLDALVILNQLIAGKNDEIESGNGNLSLMVHL